MTTEPLPADWAIERALELRGHNPASLMIVKTSPLMFPNIIAQARGIEIERERGK